MSRNFGLDMTVGKRFFLRCKITGLLLMAFAVVLSGEPCCRGAENTMQNVADSDRALHQLIVKELAVRLAMSNRWTALPANISAIFCPNDGTPLFAVAAPAGPKFPSTTGGDYVTDMETFRVVRFGNILGASKSEVVLHDPTSFSRFGSQAWNKVVVVQGGRIQQFDLPMPLIVNSALAIDDSWGVIHNGGVKINTSTNLGDTDYPNHHYPAVVIRNGLETVILTHPFGPLYGKQEGKLVLAYKNQQNIVREEFKENSQFNFALQGVIRLNDGNWLSIGNRLMVMQTNFPFAPPESKLQAVLKAVDAKDRIGFQTALESATCYSPEQLQGLIQLLIKKTPAVVSDGDVEYAAKQAVQAAERWKLPENLDPEQKVRLSALMESYRKDSERLLQQIEEIRKGPLGVSPATAAKFIETGYQYFGGLWIGAPRLLKQEGLHSALLDLVYLSPDNAPRHGVFRLNSERALVLLGDYGAVMDNRYGQPHGPADASQRHLFETQTPYVLGFQKPGNLFDQPCQFVEANEGEVILFFGYQGLGRIAGGVFEWLDTSSQFKRMSHFLGADRAGRYYFSSAPAFMSHSITGSTFRSAAGAATPWAVPVTFGASAEDLWVYRRGMPETISPIKMLIPLVSLPVMNPSNAIWFLPLKESTRNLWPQGAGALGGSPPAALARDRLQKILSGVLPSVRSGAKSLFGGDPAEDLYLTALCRMDGDQFSAIITNVFGNVMLSAENSDVVLGYSWSDKNSSAFLLDATNVVQGESLHDIALKAYDALFRAAPASFQHAPYYVPNYKLLEPNNHPSFARIGDDLWVHHRQQLEVYRNGKPVGMQTRLTLLNCPRDIVAEGPLYSPAGPAVFILGHPQPSAAAPRPPAATYFWAATSEANIELSQGSIGDMDSSTDIPLVNPLKGRVYLPRYITPACYWTLSYSNNAVEEWRKGRCYWANKKGDLICQRTEAVLSGLRLYGDASQTDIPLSYARKLQIVDESDDGTLVCRTAEGLLWLKPNPEGGYIPGREIQTHAGGFVLSLIGETAQLLYVTLADARQNLYLAVIDKSLAENSR